MATENKTTRPRRTPEQKAQDGLATARERLDKAKQRAQAAHTAASQADAEVERAERQVRYAEAHPDLPVQEQAEELQPA